jgi:hypothetical protein
MKGWLGCWAAISILALVGAVPASAAGKFTPGTEFIYSGTLEWKQSGKGVPKIAYRAPVKIWALGTEAVPTQGYTTIQLRDMRPEKGPGLTDLPPYAEVFTDRYRPNFASAGGPERPSRSVFGDPLMPLLWNRPIPYGSSSDLHVGQSWTTNEFLVLAGVRSPTVLYRVVGQTRSGGRNCLKLQSTIEDPPSRSEYSGTTIELTDYTGSRCIEQGSGLLVSDQWSATVLYTAGGRQARLDVKAAIALVNTRQLPPEQIARRVQQAAAIGSIEQTAFGQPAPDRKKQISDLQQSIAKFRREYPGSAYAAALDPIATYVEPEAHRLALMGSPAPEFRLMDLEGKQQTLGAYRGKLILLNFFASW